MNELTTLAKFIYKTATNNSNWATLFGQTFMEEVIPIEVDLTKPVPMFVSGSHGDTKGAFGYRLKVASTFQIKGVIEGYDFKQLAPVSNLIDLIFDWQNQINPDTGTPTSQQTFIDPDDVTIHFLIMSMTRIRSIKYCNFADGVNYCHLGGEYEIQYYKN